MLQLRVKVRCKGSICIYHSNDLTRVAVSGKDVTAVLPMCHWCCDAQSRSSTSHLKRSATWWIGDVDQHERPPHHWQWSRWVHQVLDRGAEPKFHTSMSSVRGSSKFCKSWGIDHSCVSSTGFLQPNELNSHLVKLRFKKCMSTRHKAIRCCACVCLSITTLVFWDWKPPQWSEMRVASICLLVFHSWKSMPLAECKRQDYSCLEKTFHHIRGHVGNEDLEVCAQEPKANSMRNCPA